MSLSMFNTIMGALVQTVWMVILSGACAVLIGLPLGVLLLVTQRSHICAAPRLQKVLAFLINSTRSVPFIILMVAIVPFTRLIVGTSIGTTAAMVPLSIAAIPFVARLVESAIEQVPTGLIEAAQAMGASPWQIIYKVLLAESLPTIVRGMTLMLITLVGYSAMAGAIGGGGLGNLAIQYGYERFETSVMLITVILLIILVQGIQMLGDRIALLLSHHATVKEKV